MKKFKLEFDSFKELKDIVNELDKHLKDMQDAKAKFLEKYNIPFDRLGDDGIAMSISDMTILFPDGRKIADMLQYIDKEMLSRIGIITNEAPKRFYDPGP